jgi:hypothetical protein
MIERKRRDELVITFSINQCLPQYVCLPLEEDDSLEEDTPIRAEMIYQHEGRTLYEVFHEYVSLEEAVNEISDCAWEEETHALMKSLFILRDNESGEILAMGMYHKGTSSEYPDRPDLVWTHADGSRERRTCHY